MIVDMFVVFNHEILGLYNIFNILSLLGFCEGTALMTKTRTKRCRKLTSSEFGCMIEVYRKEMPECAYGFFLQEAPYQPHASMAQRRVPVRFSVKSIHICCTLGEEKKAEAVQFAAYQPLG